MTKSRMFLLSLGLIAVVIFVINYALGSILSAPAQAHIGAAPTDLPAEDITITTERGNLVSGWLISGKQGQGVVILMHGVRSNRLQMIDRARFLHEAGYTVVLFDFQAHGKSEGEQITFGYLESQDVTAVYHFVRQRLPNEKIAALGVSLGGASVLLSPFAKHLDALILESVYSDLETAIANRLEIRLGVIGRYITPLLSLQIKPRLGFDVDELSPISKISELKMPIYILSGGKDQHTKVSETKRFYELAPHPKALWILPDAAHVDLHKHDPVEYQQRILKFLSDNL